MIITNVVRQVHRADRYSIFVDGKYAFSLSESGLLESGLASGQEIDKLRLQKLKKTAVADKAYSQALRYVSLRPRSEWEMQTYLKRKNADETTTAKIIRRLKDLDLLNDLNFARSWVASRRLLKNTNKRRLSLELKQKHLDSEVIDQVLAEDQSSDLDSLRQLVAKKQARYPDRQKFMRYLASQGFNYDDIKSALDNEE